MEQQDIFSDAVFQQELEQLRQQGLKDNPLRVAYETQVHGLKAEAEQLAAQGLSQEEIARRLHARRRELGREFKLASPPLFQQYIYAATAAKYGDPLGPTFEQLRLRKTCAEIIESASRPIEDLNDRLTVEGFAAWYEQQKMTKTPV